MTSDDRRLLFSIAYRMTGSVAHAEDLVQDAYFRMERAQQRGTVIDSPTAFLASTTTRLAIDHLRSARTRRETYIGPWLPEPIVADIHQSPDDMAELSDSLSMAFLIVLESLSPVERAVFLLREVFGYEYPEIAEVVDKSESNCRQIFARSRRHLDAHRTRYDVSSEQSETLVRSFLTATQEGDIDQLIELLAADAVFTGDGGGKAHAIAEPVNGGAHIAAVLIDIFGRASEAGVGAQPAVVNGGPGFVTRDGEGRIVSVMSLEMADGQIQSLRSVVNPDKLGHLGPVSDWLRKDGGAR